MPLILPIHSPVWMCNAVPAQDKTVITDNQHCKPQCAPTSWRCEHSLKVFSAVFFLFSKVVTGLKCLIPSNIVTAFQLGEGAAPSPYCLGTLLDLQCAARINFFFFYI